MTTSILVSAIILLVAGLALSCLSLAQLETLLATNIRFPTGVHLLLGYASLAVVGVVAVGFGSALLTPGQSTVSYALAGLVLVGCVYGPGRGLRRDERRQLA
jgi:hypothetical protein